jgi:2-polyprenyl-3-methyl-5-hydroxy-6-metoxy-1,4-benzoquinol methylase
MHTHEDSYPVNCGDDPVERDVLFGVINRFIGYFTRRAVPKTTNNTRLEYPFVAMDTRQACEQLLFVRNFLGRHDRFRPGMKFIDVGCGIGNILLFAEMIEFDIYGIEKDQGSLTIAQQLFDAQIVSDQDIWSFNRWSEFDVIYYFRPFCEKELQRRFERLIEESCKPGAILIANRKMGDDVERNPLFTRIGGSLPVWQKAI